MKSIQRLWAELNAVRRAIRVADKYGFQTAAFLRQQEEKLKEQITEQTKRDQE